MRVERSSREQTCVTRKSGAEKSSKHGASATHLLNFTYAPLPSQEDGGYGRTPGYQRGGRVRRTAVHTKEQFLQVNLNFSVNLDLYANFVVLDYNDRRFNN